MSIKLIQQRFDSAASQYDNAAFLQKEIANRLFERLNILKSAPRIALDIGSGTGYSLDLFKSHFPDTFVIGSDFAFNMCSEAKRKTGFPLICADAHQLPLPDASIDWVIGSCVLQWTDPEIIFKEAKRILKPGGILFLSTFGPDTLKECRTSWEAADKKPHVHDFPDMHDLADLLLKNGFEDPVADREDITVTYSTPSLLLKDLKTIGAQNALPSRRKGLMGKNRLKSFNGAYQQFKREDGTYPATYEVIYLHANKRRASGSTSDPFRLPPDLSK